MRLNKLFSILFVALLVVPMLSSAEIYKWKDKNGVTRYSDIPPPVTIKADTIGKSGVRKPLNRPLGPSAKEENPEKAEKSEDNGFKEPPPSPEEEAARLKARNAETERRNQEEEERMAKLNKENCKAAKSNYQTFSQGGRIYKTNESGEREYYGDDELKKAKAKAQREIKKFCK